MAALAVALILPAAASPALHAQRLGPPASYESGRAKGTGEHRGFLPGLTDEQRDAMRAIRLEAAERSLPIQNQLRENRARLRTLSTADPVDERAAQAVLDEIGNLRTQLMRIRWESGQSVRELLTEEQRILFDQRHFQGMSGRAGAGQPGRGRAGGPGAGPRHERSGGSDGSYGSGSQGYGRHGNTPNGNGPGRGQRGGGWNR